MTTWLLFALLTGCGSTPESPVDKAAAIARAIDAEPDRAAEIIAEHGMTEASLDALMFEIAEDPALTEAFLEARGQ